MTYYWDQGLGEQPTLTFMNTGDIRKCRTEVPEGPCPPTGMLRAFFRLCPSHTGVAGDWCCKLTTQDPARVPQPLDNTHGNPHRRE